MTGMDFPVEPKENEPAGLKLKVPATNKTGPSPNIAYAGIIQALLNSAKNMRLDATEVTVAPPIKQLAAICHCAERSVQRILEKLQAHGIIERKNRGAHLSTVYVIYKYTRILEDKKAGKPYFSHSRHDKVVTPRHDNVVTPETSVEVTTQRSEVTTQPPEVTTTPPRGDKVVVLRDKALGREALGVNPLSTAPENVSFGSSTGAPDPAPGTHNTNGSPTTISSAPGTGLSPRQLFEKFDFLKSDKANMVGFYERLSTADKILIWNHYPEHQQALREGLES